MNPIRKACEVVGSQRALADLMGITPGALSQWASGHRIIPIERCPEVERYTGGAVRCEDLRPDFDWAYLRGTGCPSADKQAA